MKVIGISQSKYVEASPKTKLQDEDFKEVHIGSGDLSDQIIITDSASPRKDSVLNERKSNLDNNNGGTHGDIID